MKFKFSQTIRNKQKIFIVLSCFILLVSIYMEKLTQELIDRQKPSILHFLFILLIFFCLSCFGYGKKYLETYIEKRGCLLYTSWFEFEKLFIGHMLQIFQSVEKIQCVASTEDPWVEKSTSETHSGRCYLWLCF